MMTIGEKTKQNGIVTGRMSFPRSGKTTYWHKNGQIHFEENYKDGDLVSETRYHYFENGQIKAELNVHNGSNVTSKYRKWYETNKEENCQQLFNFCIRFYCNKGF